MIMYRKLSLKGFLIMSHNFGPLESLLNDSAITAIQMSASKIEYHKNGQVQTHDASFQNESEFSTVVTAILQAANQTLSADNSQVNCVLSDGTKIHATYQPLFISLTKAS